MGKGYSVLVMLCGSSDRPAIAGMYWLASIRGVIHTSRPLVIRHPNAQALVAACMLTSLKAGIILVLPYSGQGSAPAEKLA